MSPVFLSEITRQVTTYHKAGQCTLYHKNPSSVDLARSYRQPPSHGAEVLPITQGICSALTFNQTREPFPRPSTAPLRGESPSGPPTPVPASPRREALSKPRTAERPRRRRLQSHSPANCQHNNTPATPISTFKTTRTENPSPAQAGKQNPQVGTSPFPSRDEAIPKQGHRNSREGD